MTSAEAAPSPKSILVVEDEDRQRDILVRHLERAGFEVVAFGRAEPALEELSTRSFSALVTDYRLPGIDGLEFLRRARAIDEELPAIVVTAFASVETAVEALRAGATDYVLKPLFFEELSRKLQNILDHRDLARENVGLRRAIQQSRPPTGYLGSSSQAERVRDWIQRAARSDATVLITGETGTGKEVIAQAIHELGVRASKPMLTVNVAALAESTLESELFGHERGAFTGAVKSRPGILRSAGSGTVFLDEIGELSLDLQAKLLRALEAREIQPVGSDKTASFEARIICATHRDLTKRVQEETFREDLYYRLNVLRIESPALRERKQDIAELAHALCARVAKRKGIPTPPMSADVIRALTAYEWPGNVRELANVIERAMILSDDSALGREHLPPEVEAQPNAPENHTQDLRTAIAGFERRHIAKVLRDCNGNRENAATALGLSPATLYRRLDKLDLKGDRANEVDEA